jgi:dCTP deaminase
MVLSNVEIHQALDDGRLVITPEPTPRIPTSTNPDCPYNTTSVDLRLGNTLSIPKPGPFAYDLRKPGIANFLVQNCDHVQIDPVGGFTLKTNQLVLGNTLERLTLPIKPDLITLAARIEGKSSFARCGLLVHFTAPTVHADFDGTLTLEMILLGQNDMVLVPGMKICQLILEEVKGTPFPAPSQFQGQISPVGSPST